MADIGSLVIRIGADASDLIKELERGEKKLDSTARAFNAAGQVAKVFAGAATAAATAIALIVKHSAEGADSMGKLAQGAGLATKTFSEYAYAAKLSDVETQALATSFARLNRNVADAGAGTGEALRGFEALGINVRDTNGTLKNADVIMEEVANKFAGMEDGAGKSAIAVMLFGRAGAALIPMLNQGAAGLRELRQEARDLGVAIDSDVAKQAEEFNDNVTRLGQVAQGAANNLMAELLPAMRDVSAEIFAAARESKGFHDEMASLADLIRSAVITTFQTAAVVGSDVAFTFKMVGGEIGVIAAQMAALARGDFKGARLIGEEWERDAAQARKDLDEFQARIMKIGENKPNTSVDQFFDFTPYEPKSKAPDIKATATGGDEQLAKQLQEGVDEEQKIQAEALAATVKFRDEQIAKEKEFSEARLKAMYEQIDAEQAAAIEQGRIMMEEDGITHSTKLLMLQESLDNGLAAEQAAYEKRLEMLQEFTDAELEALGGRDAVKEQMERDHQERMRQLTGKGLDGVQKIVEQARQGDVKGAVSTFATLTAGLASHNRKMFELNKAAGIANAIISAYEGIALTMKTYPFPLSVAMAAAQAGIAFAQVSAISSQSFGGGGGAAPSLAGSTPAPATTPVQSGTPESSQTLFVSGINASDLFTGDVVHGLIDKLIEAQRGGARIVLRS